MQCGWGIIRGTGSWCLHSLSPCWRAHFLASGEDNVFCRWQSSSTLRVDHRGSAAQAAFISELHGIQSTQNEHMSLETHHASRADYMLRSQYYSNEQKVILQTGMMHKYQKQSV